MTILTRFPARIRFVNPDGTLTPEAARLLDTIISRAGGAMGDLGDDVFAAAIGDDSGAGPAVDVLAPAVPSAGEAAADVAAPAASVGHMAPVDLQPVSHSGFSETTFQGSSE